VFKLSLRSTDVTWLPPHWLKTSTNPDLEIANEFSDQYSFYQLRVSADQFLDIRDLNNEVKRDNPDVIEMVRRVHETLVLINNGEDIFN